MTSTSKSKFHSLRVAMLAAVAAAMLGAGPVRAGNAELEKYQTAEKLANEHLAKFDTLDFDVFTNQKWDRMKESHAPNVKVHMPDGRIIEGIDAHIEDLKSNFVSFPDSRVLEHPIKIANGEWTSVIGIMEGTFTKPIVLADGKEIAPTGKAYRMKMATVAHWKDGVMDEEFLFWDNRELLKQIGLAE